MVRDDDASSCNHDADDDDDDDDDMQAVAMHLWYGDVPSQGGHRKQQAQRCVCM